MGKKYKYAQRSADSVKERAEQKAGQFDRPLKEGTKFFSPKADTKYKIRIMPPTWDDPDHFGHDVYMVYGVGADASAYLSLAKMKGKKDPIEEERFAAERDGDAEAAKQLVPRKRVALYLIDRAAEEEGPQVWLAPYTFDKDLTAIMIDDSGKVLDIDDPDGGYDVSFQRQGSGLKTKYIGVAIARRESSLSSDDETQEQWMEQIVSTPLPDTFNYYSYEHIHKALHGGAPTGDDEDKTREEESDEDEDEDADTRKKLKSLDKKRDANKKPKKDKKDKKGKKKDK